MFDLSGLEHVRLLDAGAGVGSLTAAVIAEFLGREAGPSRIDATAYEVDPALASDLRLTMTNCLKAASQAGVRLDCTVFDRDFIADAASALTSGLFENATDVGTYDAVIMNPPYRKIARDGPERRLLRDAGIETGNLYTGFLSLAAMLLRPGGELVAITPRSFCNGPYFREFRHLFLSLMSFRQVHVYEQRGLAFADDEVLQENVILHATRGGDRSHAVIVTSSRGPDESQEVRRLVPYDEFVRPTDSAQFIRIVPDEHGRSIDRRMRRFTTTLTDLGLNVSTGRVVDFRVRDALSDAIDDEHTVPLIYPHNLESGRIVWPKLKGRKASSLRLTPETTGRSIPAAVYVVVKRFSAKEERRRVTAAVYNPARVSTKPVAFDNKLNYFHTAGLGLPIRLAQGLTMWLNSSLVDVYFRQFSGHTQVNATDLRSMTYPTCAELDRLGSRVAEDCLPEQSELDAIIDAELPNYGEEENAPTR